MRNNKPTILFYFLSLFLLFACEPNQEIEAYKVDVLVIGGGTGGTAAGIQAARMGAKTLIIEPTVWLGGMLTAAGVSATDGNHHMPAGIWGEFRDSLRQHYGGAEALATGWVSHTQFEPSVGAAIFQRMAEAEENLEVWFETKCHLVSYEDGYWKVFIITKGGSDYIKAKILIDGTDLGDIAASQGASYDLGMDAASKTGEKMAPAEVKS
ncbi:MAG: FAD-dependent oxidoreductase [Bacteroidota bacterium]